MRCPACGMESTGSTKFCEFCGAAMPPSDVPVQGQQTAPVQPASDNTQFQQPGASYQVQPQAQQQAAYQQIQPQPQAQTQAQQQAPYQQPQGQPQPQGQNPTYQQPQPPSYQPQGAEASNAPFVLAIIALVTAVLGMFPVSLVLAIIALVMNSGQKKRGETSTKQTPTFVMSLISLILSVIMGIATLLLGGVIWLALLDEDSPGEITITTSSEPAKASLSEEDVIGTWKAVSLSLDDEYYDEDDLEAYEAEGWNAQLVIVKGGTAWISIPGEQMDGTWKLGKASTVTLSFEDFTVDAAVENGLLTMEEDGDEMVFRRVSTNAATPEASSSSSKSSDAASSQSSSSASASSPASAASFSTSEVPTMADFAWFTPDMFSGKVPAGVNLITDANDVIGGWKMYAFGTELERFLNVNIEGSASSMSVTLNWNTVYDGAADRSYSDSQPPSTFNGTWSNGLTDLVGTSGKLTITGFWQQNGHQYAVGTYMWPSGEVDELAFVRP